MKVTLLFAIPVLALAQAPVELMTGTGGLASGITVRYKTVVEPPVRSPEFAAFSGGVAARKDVVHRFLYDSSTYVGYDVTAVPGETAGTYKVSFQPLSLDSVEATGKRNLLPAPQPVFPGPQIVQEGDTIALELLASPDGKHKIVDYIQIVATEKAQTRAAGTTPAPRDLTFDDGPVRFDSFPGTTVSINGQKFEGQVAFSTRPGATFWVYFPGRQMYILSLAQVSGAELAGTIRDNVLAFHADGEQYELRFGSPAASPDKAFNVYLLRNPDYRPKSELMNAVVGGVDRLENLLPKR